MNGEWIENNFLLGYCSQNNHGDCLRCFFKKVVTWREVGAQREKQMGQWENDNDIMKNKTFKEKSFFDFNYDFNSLLIVVS